MRCCWRAWPAALSRRWRNSKRAAIQGAAALRLEWAQDLAARGDLAEAALAVWPLADERARALAWLREAEQGGGSLGVQGLLYTLAVDSDALRPRRETLEALLFAPGPEAVRQRIRACDCLLPARRPQRRHAGVAGACGACWRPNAAPASMRCRANA